ncbi:MAG: GNAT family N-acetyltransferase [Clostridia bacterium]|nr:GNAT family N-acetyltransferase [Clostridia bacterium]
MAVRLRKYNKKAGFSEDFHKVREFLIRINSNEFVCINYLWERWEWSFCLESLTEDNLGKMGIWEDKGRIVAMTGLEQDLGEVYPFVDGRYGPLKKNVLEYSVKHLSKDGSLKILIQDDDPEFQIVARSMGFYPTQHKDPKSVLDITGEIAYDLPVGFTICSLADTYDLYKYNRVLWRGFNHEGTPPEDEGHIKGREISLSGPHQDMNLCIAVAAPDGNFVSYCGMLYDEATDYAMVEPVATDPDYRKMGLGRAVVLEGAKRCRELGAKRAYVGSSQQFYYKIGFRPVPGGTFWELA